MSTLIFSDDFDGGVTTGWDEATFTDAHYAPTIPSQQKFVTTPASPVGASHVINYYALSGTNEVNVVRLLKELTDMDEVYAIWRERFAPGYPWPTTSQKMARLYYYDEAHPESRKEITVVASQENLYVDYSFACGLWGDSSVCNVDFANNVGASPHPMDEWVKWGLHVKLNTSGLEDGFIKLYRNDILVTSNIDVDLRGTDTRGFNAIIFGMNYSMAGGDGPLTGSGNRYLSKIEIWDGDPNEGVVEDPIVGVSPGRVQSMKFGGGGRP